MFYTDHFELPLPDGHRFPMSKYRLLRERVIEHGLAGPGELRIPEPASDEELSLAHDPDYIRRVARGDLSDLEVRRIGFPWTPQLVERSRRSTGATIAAARAALVEGLAANLAGGTHHAFPGSGEGYCVFNDTAVAARVLQGGAQIRRAVIIDCDVHQGNGTAAMTADDPSLFSFSIHGEKNFPFRKCESDLDIALPDRCGDEEYLRALREGLDQVFIRFDAEAAFYIAGADPFIGDRLGRLDLSKEGLAARDRLVLGECRKRGLPVTITMAGGYAPNIDDIVDIHEQTLRIAIDLEPRAQATG